MKHPCIDCNVEMQRAISTLRGLRLEAMQCPKCKSKVFTQEQATKVADAFKAQRLKTEYRRDIITIGSSSGLTLPKDIVDAFDLKGKKVTINPLMSKRKIELLVD